MIITYINVTLRNTKRNYSFAARYWSGNLQRYGYLMSTWRQAVVLGFFLIASCASVSQRSAEIQTYDYANVLLERGSYEDAHDAYRYLAETYPTSRMTEEAAFKAAYILVYYKNPDRDFAGAQREFTDFLLRYPKGTLADEAQSWIALLKSFDQSKTHEFMMEVGLLSKKINILWTEIEEKKADSKILEREKATLFAEKEDLSKKVDELLKEQEVLLGEKKTVTAERNELEQDKIALQKRVLSLTEEKNKLILAKKKLEKSLHDLTMVDVRTEKQRKKIKKEETNGDKSSLPH
jgi:hypothetical protein